MQLRGRRKPDPNQAKGVLERDGSPGESLPGVRRVEGRLAEGRGVQSGGVGGLGGRGGPRNMATLWYKDEEGALQLLPIRTGVSDGITTEIIPVRDEELPEGLEIISQVLTPSLTQDTSLPRGGPGGDRGRGRGGLGRLGF